MSVDRRLREGLQRSAAAFDPDVARRLPEALTRGRRRRRARRAMLALATVVLLAGAGGVLLQISHIVQRTHPAAPSPKRTLGPYVAIAGTYTSTLSPSSTVVRDNAMVGTWRVRLDPDGVMQLSAPKAFRDVPSAAAFKIEGDQFTTDAFVNDPRCANDVGVYRWRRSGATLTFVPITERCALRRTLFSAGQWRTNS